LLPARLASGEPDERYPAVSARPIIRHASSGFVAKAVSSEIPAALALHLGRGGALLQVTRLVAETAQGVHD
jgi:hypothetical protein